MVASNGIKSILSVFKIHPAIFQIKHVDTRTDTTTNLLCIQVTCIMKMTHIKDTCLLGCHPEQHIKGNYCIKGTFLWNIRNQNHCYSA